MYTGEEVRSTAASLVEVVVLMYSSNPTQDPPRLAPRDGAIACEYLLFGGGGGRIRWDGDK